jgi:hypothetical protein
MVVNKKEGSTANPSNNDEEACTVLHESVYIMISFEEKLVHNQQRYN